MQEWEAALAEFLKDWTGRDDVIGALVCGSYVTGAPSQRSDIDVHILLSDELDWRERGNKIVNGYLIEYFANPPRQIRGYFDQDHLHRTSMSMVQFITGRILYDPAGVVAELKAEAAEWMGKQRETLDEPSVEIKKYEIWDDLDNLKACFEQERADFHFTYHNSLLRLFTAYCRFLNMETIPHYQIYSYLSDPLFLQKYVKTPFPDEPFKQAFLDALQETDRDGMLDRHERLSRHVWEQMGGFEIDGWKLRDEVDFYL